MADRRTLIAIVALGIVVLVAALAVGTLFLPPGGPGPTSLPASTQSSAPSDGRQTAPAVSPTGPGGPTIGPGASSSPTDEPGASSSPAMPSATPRPAPTPTSTRTMATPVPTAAQATGAPAPTIEIPPPAN